MAMKKSTLPIVIGVLLVAAMAAAPKAQAQFGIFKRLLALLRIQGTVFCTANGQIGVNGTSTPVFPNAVVQLQCGNGTSVVSSAITNSLGIFSILLDPITILLNLTALLQNCQLVVTTPLSTCNAALPAVGGLLSGLQALGTTIIGLLNIINIVPTGFSFAQNLNA